MRRVLSCLLVLLAAVVVAEAPPAHATGYYGGYRYSSYYSPGYTYYHAGNYGGSYYPAGYYAPAYQMYSAYQTYYQPPVNLAVFQPYLANYYAYSTYQPQAVVPLQQLNAIAAVPVQQQAATGVDPGCAKHTAALQLRLEKLEAMLNKQTAPPPAPAPQPQAEPVRQQAPAPKAPPTGARVWDARCLSCHGAAVAQARAKGMVLPADASLLTDVQLAGVYRQLVSGRMPKDGPLTPEEGQALLLNLNNAKGKK